VKSYPTWICDPCGTKYGTWYASGQYTGPASHCATYHHGKCGICNDQDVPVTEPRDFGHLLDWDVLSKNLSGDYNRKKYRKTRKARTD
jgi:hypothetical protein